MQSVREGAGGVPAPPLARPRVAARSRRLDAGAHAEEHGGVDPSGVRSTRSSDSPGPIILSAQATAEVRAAPNAEPLSTGDTAAVGEVLAALDEAVGLLEAGRNVEARTILSELYLRSRGELAAKLRGSLDHVNEELVFNPRCVEGAMIHVVQAGETLTSIGKKYALNWRMIARINGMKNDRLRVGQKLKMLAGSTSAVVYKGEFRLALLLDGIYVKEYLIGIGKDDLTPAGEFVVDNMLVKPKWYKPGGGIVDYGEEGNLLGERWIGFADEPGASGLGIHGTNEQQSLGTKCSNGCIRMRNDDVIEFYDFMRLGSRVVIEE